MLPAVLTEIARVCPYLHGQAGPERGEQHSLIGELYAHWQSRTPEAGVHYWRARSWGMLMWQPAYACVLAVHCAHRALDLEHFWQTVCAGVTHSWTLPADAANSEASTPVITQAAQSLLRYHHAHYKQLVQLSRYSAKQAACMTVDCVLSALLLVAQHFKWSAHQLDAQTACWLDALGWQQHGSVMQVRLPSGACVPALNRQGCCQHFRLPGQEACSTCPRWPIPIRLEKIRLELEPT
ncbi:siderophore ferric iron reductase [Chitinibacter tainanensis]|uniref:siderophore ferric iron reductase n=1 Tax=Chitinibacter tainanensis TaxID=230667 RepID=UPI00040C1444|nr:siderophore ferric iron reductase [Chitinibacter tainanensis]